jgi:hypothetical protein
LANHTCHGRNIFINKCGGPNYAANEGAHITAESGRVGFDVSAGTATTTCFGLGLIVDNSIYGTNYINSDINTVRWERLSLQSVYGDGVFYSVSEGGISNANASWFDIVDTSYVTEAIIAINGGWMNRVEIQEAIQAKQIVRLSVFRPDATAQCISNSISVVYSGDGIGTGLYIDDRYDGVNHDDSIKSNALKIQSTVDMSSPLFNAVAGASIETLSSNGAIVMVGGKGNVRAFNISKGFSGSWSEADYQSAFNGVAGNLEVSLVNDVLSESNTNLLSRCTYEVFAKVNNGDGSLDGYGHYMVSFWSGSAEGGAITQVGGGSGRTVSLDLTTPTNPKIVFSSASTVNFAGVIMRKVGSYFWGT